MNTNNRRLLLIEDQLADRRLIEELLAELADPPQCMTASTLAEGIDRLQGDGSFDAVLSDLGLPDSDGIETVHALLEATEHLPLVVLTGRDDSDLARQSVLLGAQDYLPKGAIDAATLERCVTYAIERKRAERSIIRSIEDIGRKNEALEQFVYMASHDLKTPLATQRGYINLMHEMVKSGDVNQVRTAAERIDSANRRMRETIDELLELTRESLQDIEAQLIDTVALVHQVADELQLQVDTNGVTLDIDSRLPAVFADKQRVRQLFENLLVNALQHGCTAAQPKVSVGAVRRDDNVHFYVRDNGPGIDPAHHDDVFRIFYRLSSTGDGSGVGLAIVRRVAESLGGRAWVESSPGEGATFWFSVPGDKAVQTDAHHDRASITRQGGAAPVGPTD